MSPERHLAPAGTPLSLAPGAAARPEPAEPAVIRRAAEALRQGALVAFPTETVYGLGADATNGAAVARVFAAKGRPRFNPLIVHVEGTSGARDLALWDTRAERLAEAFWPGPLSLVLPLRADAPVASLATAGLDTVALRCPDHPVALDLLREAACPLAAPSANPSGRVSPTRASHVAEALARECAVILDAGPCRVGLESTVLDLSGDQPALLRPGGVTQAALESILGPVVGRPDVTTGPARAPGQLASHYAPSRPVRLDAKEPTEQAGEALLRFGPEAPAGYDPIYDLSARGDLEEAAARLFDGLRALDRPGVAGIAVMPIPEIGLGVAMNDRLRRAAAPVEGDGDG